MFGLAVRIQHPLPKRKLWEVGIEQDEAVAEN